MNHFIEQNKNTTSMEGQSVNYFEQSSIEQGSKELSTTHLCETGTSPTEYYTKDTRKNLTKRSDSDAGVCFIFFSDKKKNIIMDGVFSKILYSNQYFTMNGIYVFVKYAECDAFVSQKRVVANSLEPCSKEFVLKEFVTELTNEEFERLCYIEHRVLNIYSTAHIDETKHKTPVYNLKNQLCSGYVKSGFGLIGESVVPKINIKSVDYSSRQYKKPFALHALLSYRLSALHGRRSPPRSENTPGTYVYVKISGVWETESTYGITFKFIVDE